MEDRNSFEEKPVETPKNPYFARSTYVPQPTAEPSERSVEPYSVPRSTPPIPERSPYAAPQPYTAPQPTYTVRQPYTTPQPTPPDRKKKKGLTGRIVALALICALMGSVCGGVLVGLFLRESNRLDRNLQDSQQKPEYTDTGAPRVPSNRDPVPTVDLAQSNLLTPTEVYKANVAAVVGIANEGTGYNIFGQPSKTASSGTGFVISTDGEILTNYHVVKDAQVLTVTMKDGAKYEAKVLGYEAESDIALIKIDAHNLQTIVYGDSDGLYEGDQVAAIGNPLGELTYSITVGYVSSKSRDVNTDGTPINMVQIDAAINPGNSGGPLFDMYGRVVGINSAKYSGTASGGSTIEGIGFAIPINDVLSILDDLREYGKVINRAYIGIRVQSVEASEEDSLPAGALVVSVEEGSCGEKAGLQAGDIIIGVNDIKIYSQPDLAKQLKKLRANDPVVFVVYRNGETLTLEAVLDVKPEE